MVPDFIESHNNVYFNPSKVSLILSTIDVSAWRWYGFLETQIVIPGFEPALQKKVSFYSGATFRTPSIGSVITWSFGMLLSQLVYQALEWE